MKTIDQHCFKGEKVLIRVDFNVPVNAEMQITDDTRMRAALPTINKVLNDGGSVILMSHRGRPKNGPEDQFSLKYLVVQLGKLLDKKVDFVADCIGCEVKEKAASLSEGSVLLLDNLRFYKEEKAGDLDFAKQLAELADVYVNDAFGTAHRAHASTAVIAQFFPEKKFFGHIMTNEIQNINKVLNTTKKPLTAIMGGAKVSSKITIISQLMDKVDNLIIGGGMTYTFAKAMGGNVGNSLVEDDKLGLALDIIESAKEKDVNLCLPIDSINADSFDNDANTALSKVDCVQDGFMGLDIGEETASQFAEVIKNSATILWNGPMGVFEMENFSKGTKAVADAIVDATSSGAFSLVGGGDSVAAINKYEMADKVSYVSTGGGAMLEYLEGKTLPGIAAIMK
ncbi:MAG: phosphoglycerate kinase [Flavobacteriales bacterium]|nr:phosphoglycerate kinase [Flavobacteriales bacterium]|tara:strand:+ start:1421 stop:2611 length:1191 start_codon:yes stop_codon:yes gene_type:complete